MLKTVGSNRNKSQSMPKINELCRRNWYIIYLCIWRFDIFMSHNCRIGLCTKFPQNFNPEILNTVVWSLSWEQQPNSSVLCVTKQSIHYYMRNIQFIIQKNIYPFKLFAQYSQIFKFFMKDIDYSLNTFQGKCLIKFSFLKIIIKILK